MSAACQHAARLTRRRRLPRKDMQRTCASRHDAAVYENIYAAKTPLRRLIYILISGVARRDRDDQRSLSAAQKEGE